MTGPRKSSPRKSSPRKNASIKNASIKSSPRKSSPKKVSPKRKAGNGLKKLSDFLYEDKYDKKFHYDGYMDEGYEQVEKKKISENETEIISNRFEYIEFNKKKYITGDLLECYYTHDNGGRPFKVLVFKNIIAVFKTSGSTYMNTDPYKDSKPIKVDVYFHLVTIIPNNGMVEDVCPSTPWVIKEIEQIIKNDPPEINKPKKETNEEKFNRWMNYTCSKGNSLLFLTPNKNEYLYISGSVFTFKTSEPITSFIAYVGNNDVPYPYAVSDHYYYLLGMGSCVSAKRTIENVDIWRYDMGFINKNGKSIYRDDGNTRIMGNNGEIVTITPKNQDEYDFELYDPNEEKLITKNIPIKMLEERIW